MKIEDIIALAGAGFSKQDIIKIAGTGSITCLLYTSRCV